MRIKYPLACTSWDEMELEAMQRVIASGNFSMGVEVECFENRFSAALGSKYSVMVNSGSSANLLMVASLFFRKDSPLKPGDEVIVPAVSWSTTYFPLQQYGLKLKFVDTDVDTLNYNLDELALAVGTDTRLIMAVNLLGNPNQFDQIFRIIKGSSIIVLEDNCESMGAKLGEKKTGTFGVLGSFSTFFSHHISTMEGGLVVTDDEELYHIMLALRAHGWTRNLPQTNKVSNKSVDSFTESFRFVLPGYNLRPLELSGAIGVEQLKKLPQLVRLRRENAERFLTIMSKYPDIRVQKEVGQSSWFGFSMILQGEKRTERASLVTHLNQNGIECRPIVAGNFVRNDVIKYFDYKIVGTLGGADTIHESGIMIGNHHFDLTEQLDHLDSALRQWMI